MSSPLARRAILGSAFATGAVLVPRPADAGPLPATAPVGMGWTAVGPTESIQKALDAGARAVLLGPGEYRLTSPLSLPAGSTVVGAGQLTRLIATKAMPAVVQIGQGAAADGVQLAALVVDCASQSATGIDLNISGTSGNYQGEPDAVCRLDNLWVYDAGQDGVSYRGSDAQGITTTRVRVRRAARHGFSITAPDNWFSECEATTSRLGGAGFFIGGANCLVTGCKAWYCRGYGFQVTGVRNQLIGCCAQDCANHGFLLQTGKNLLSACLADSCSAAATGGTPNAADGFYATYDDSTALVGCQAFDRRAGGRPAQQRYGFNVPRSMVERGTLAAPTGYDNVSGLVRAR
jgi:hypothetical protein